MRSILSFLVLVVLFSGARVGSETLPPFEINRKYTLVQVGEKGRVNTETGLIGTGAGDGMPLLAAAEPDEKK